MQHVDEGMIHAFLDGELSPAEATEFERHISVCAPCRAKFAEEKAFLTEAADLVVALDNVAPSTRPATTALPFRRARPWVLRPAALAWAASIVAAAAIGYTWRGAPTFRTAEELSTAPQVAPIQEDRGAEMAPQPSTPAPAVTGPTALATAPAVRQGRAARTAPSSETPVPAAVPQEPQVMALAEATPAPATMAAGAGVSRADAAVDPAPSAAKPLPAADEGAANYAPTQETRSFAYIQGVPVDTTAVAAAGRLAFGPANTPEPKRITMDEAVSLLGGSIRLIDGLTPQRVEVIAGIDVPGADPARQVVRIYYEEPDLGLVTLDQQRPGPSFEVQRRAESEPPAVATVPFDPAARTRRNTYAGSPMNTLAWRADGVWLALTTRLPAERMAALQARVR